MTDADHAPGAGRFRRFLWNRKIGLALLIAAPAILGFVGAQLSDYVLDAKLRKLKAESQQVQRSIGELDRVTRDFETFETLRSSFALDLVASNAPQEVRYLLDKFYRTKALSSLRRIAAGVDQSGWKERIAAYEKLVAADYSTRDNVQALQDAENGVLADAKAKLTTAQARANTLAEQIDVAEDRKTFWSELFKFFGWIVTAISFFIKETG